MSALSSTLKMLGTYAFGRTLSGLRGLGSGQSAFSALAGLGAMPTNKQEKQLAQAVENALNANAGQLKTIAASYGKEFGTGEEADLVQQARIKMLIKARTDKAFAADPEAWIKKFVTKAYLRRMIENAWVSYTRSPRAKTFESGDVSASDSEGIDQESVLERAAADPEAAGGHEFSERMIRANREVPALFRLLTRHLDKVRRGQLYDLMTLGQTAMDEAARLIRNGYAPAEARRQAYTTAAYAWSRKHTEAAPGYAVEAGGDVSFDHDRFQRDLKLLLSRLRQIGEGGGRPLTANQGVFLSFERRGKELVSKQRGPVAEGDLELPSSNIPTDDDDKRTYIRAPSFFESKPSDYDAWAKMAEKGHKAFLKEQRRQAKRDASAAKKDAKAAAVQQRKEDRKAARIARLAEKTARIAKAREDKTAALDLAAAKLEKKRKELAAKADSLTLEELTKRRAVIDGMAKKLTEKRAKLAAKQLKTSSSSAPAEPSFADRLMAIKAVDREDAIDKTEKAYAVQDKAAASLKGVSAFGGLMNGKRKGKKSAKRRSRR